MWANLNNLALPYRCNNLGFEEFLIQLKVV